MLPFLTIHCNIIPYFLHILFINTLLLGVYTRFSFFALSISPQSRLGLGVGAFGTCGRFVPQPLMFTYIFSHYYFSYNFSWIFSWILLWTLSWTLSWTFILFYYSFSINRGRLAAPPNLRPLRLFLVYIKQAHLAWGWEFSKNNKIRSESQFFVDIRNLRFRFRVRAHLGKALARGRCPCALRRRDWRPFLAWSPAKKQLSNKFCKNFNFIQ